jgi:dTDP-4-amino-4,6-dideoxygalactose transaminase
MENNIPFFDLSRQHENIKEAVFAALHTVCGQTAFSGGPFVDAFEKDFSSTCKTKHAIGVNSGTSALHLTMLALGIGKDDEVIIPANTFIATAWAPSYVEATPVFADCRPDTWNIDPLSIEGKLTARTKAVIGVHLYGQPFDIDAVKSVCAKHGIFFVEDCAQAHGAQYKGIPVGGFGEIGCFSFYPGKNLGAYGEGGAVVTNNEAYDTHIRKLRNHASQVRYYHDELGFNMRMDGFQAAILSVKLKFLQTWNTTRKKIAARYREGITNHTITVQYQPEWAESVYHLFVVTTADREGFIEYLKSHGIGSGLHYPVPCHLQKAYRDLGYKEGDLPNAEYLAKHCVSLPMFPEMEEHEVSRVIDVVNTYSK